MSLKKIGPYEFLEVVGRGGMGSVHKARHQQTQEIHAVKVLAPRFSDEEHFRNRFESEIKSLIKLDHPNIVRILSFGQEQGNLYFGMELVDGKSLFQLQKEKYPFDWRDILKIGLDVAYGLRHAHDRGIIHRDLKPGNLLALMDADNKIRQIKITDFGIAKRYGASQNTGENVIGTMDFMSPEQAKGEPVTVRSDLFSLGTVLYTLLAGKPPFHGESMEDSIRKLIVASAPPIRQLNPEVPREVEKLLQHLMNRFPEDRVPTALALTYKINEINNHLAALDEDHEFHEESDSDDSHNSVTAEIRVSSSKPTEEKTFSDQKNTRHGDEKQNVVDAAATSAAAYQTDDYKLAESDSSEEDDFELSSGHTSPPVRDIDYFNTVTDHARKHHESLFGEREKKQGGVLLILLCLVAVLAVAAYGVYRASLPPTADELLEVIETSQAHPEEVVPSSQQFMELYPKHDSVERVSQLYTWGEAVLTVRRLTNKLSVMAKLPGEQRLSEIEQHFLEIEELAETRPEAAAAKMAALVTVYQNHDDLSTRDRAVIEAAKKFPTSLQSRQRTDDIERLDKLTSAMDAAAKQSNPVTAAEVYQSILDLYGDVRWGETPAGQAGRKQMDLARQRVLEKQWEIKREGKKKK